jgi:hypothetical protein
MRWMRADPTRLLDHVGDPRGGPDLSTEPEGFGTFCQQGGHRGLVVLAPFPWATRRRLMTPRVRSLCVGLVDPLAHRTLGHAKGFRDLLLGPPTFRECDGLQAALFTPICLPRCLCAQTSFSRQVGAGLSFFSLRSITCLVLRPPSFEKKEKMRYAFCTL